MIERKKEEMVLYMHSFSFLSFDTHYNTVKSMWHRPRSKVRERERERERERARPEKRTQGG